MVTGKPAIELQAVTLPDYLDTSDIVLRSGQNELKISETGRWAGRLSDELNRALRADLASRLPDAQVAAAQPPIKSALQIRVTVEAFDVRPDGRFVLSAGWAILDKNTRSVLISQRGAFISSTKDAAGAIGNASIVAAMAASTGQLADAIAAAVNEISL